MLSYTTCGSGSNNQQCRQTFITDNQVAKFKCVTDTNAGSRCIPALDDNGNADTKPCMKLTYCI
jgi:hypothetical protein